MADPAKQIRIGTLVPGGEQTKSYIDQIKDYGFESFSVNFPPTLGDFDLDKLLKPLIADLEKEDRVISSLCVYGNPLETDNEAESARDTWSKLITAASNHGIGVVGGFTGRLRGKPINECIPRFKEVFSPLADKAQNYGIKLAFENCEMGGNWHSGDWNIAHTPAAWELMFEAVPSDNIGLQWEPCHQMVKLIDPIAQLRKWAPKVFHLHGKDATICWDIIHQHGIGGSHAFAYHRTPGFGDSNWRDIITILRQNGFEGSIDIEGWHDPVYCQELEMTGQVHGLNYLKWCRGGDFVPNPT